MSSNQIQNHTKPKGSRKNNGTRAKRFRNPKGSEQSPFSADFQARVNRLDKLMSLAAKTPDAPPGFVLMKQPKDAGGTLEQVGREADNAWAGVKKIMSLLNVESKHLYYHNSTSVTQAGAVLDMGSLITQGVGGAQRVGDSVKIQRFKVKVAVQAITSPTDITIVVGRSKDGIPATMGDIFAQVSNNEAGLNFPIDTYEQADKWLASRSFSLVPNTSSARHYHEFDVKIDQDLLYTNGSTTVSSGAIWFASIANDAANFPGIAYSFDITFVDN